MSDRKFFIVLHGCFPREGLTLPDEVCVHELPRYTGEDRYAALLDRAMAYASSNPVGLGHLDSLERVIFYSTTSDPYSVRGQEFLWLAGLIPHPENKDPNWMG